jgi:hypothetical protein
MPRQVGIKSQLMLNPTSLGTLPYALFITSSCFDIHVLLLLVDEVGLEPTMPEAEDLQSSGVTNFPTHPLFGTRGGTRTRMPFDGRF